MGTLDGRTVLGPEFIAQQIKHLECRQCLLWRPVILQPQPRAPQGCCSSDLQVVEGWQGDPAQQM